MNDLREKLADVAEVAIDNVHDMDVTHRDYAEAAAQAFIAALPDMVVPLVWVPAERGVQEAKAGGEIYVVEERGTEFRSNCGGAAESEASAKSDCHAAYVATALAAFGVQGGEA